MKIFRILQVSIRALTRNKMRSFLTILGIIIGVAAVIAMVSVGEGAKQGIQQRFASMGTNLLFVYPGSRNFRGVATGAGGYTNLKPEDAKAIEENCDAVQATSPSISTRAQVVYANKNWNTQIQGTGEKFPFIRDWPVSEGTYFDEAQVAAAAKVCVLGSEVKQNLFEDEDPIGKTIRISKIPFKVIGVLESKGEQGGFFNRDDMIAVPYTTVMKRLRNVDYITSIDVSAVSADKTEEAQRQIEELMRDRHHIMPGSDDDFQVRNIADVAQSAAESTQIMTILLGSIASISLIVGGIGIMNIMLVSVTERIREIGVRLAVGARERDILLQFLIEAVVLSVGGGLIGIIVGIGTSRLMKYVSVFQGITTVVTPGSILLAFIFSASVGIFFGYYPARKASRLDPIEALRYE
ncbi:MAG: ABC transporter permease [Candidatus Saccharicenans sp.]|nr:MAG: multidrug ABC transporter substrate-binding protein [Candidatus Aminicenantes bacterium]HEK85544.1 FtsX-like permease family protein [Candidatus Aminicenantes bacterium]